MNDLREQVRVQAASLIKAFGCHEAAAEAVNARLGTSLVKGTLSRVISGQLDISHVAVWAMEDALGRYPLTRLGMRRLTEASAVAPGDFISDSSSIAKESGEAVSALLSAQVSAKARDRSEALRELYEARDAIDCAIARLEGTP
ncbi:MAG: hypothetical protein VX874_15775 [Pseudomonadota bacterium]|nr:hypothetical protein [Pseudomonadota bacterium]